MTSRALILARVPMTHIQDYIGGRWPDPRVRYCTFFNKGRVYHDRLSDRDTAHKRLYDLARGSEQLVQGDELRARLADLSKEIAT